MEYRDYYATLGLPRTASQADIKKAFRRLARKHHPDVNTGNAEAEQRFKEISEANEVLSDPQKRRAYDAMGPDWAAWQRAGATGARGAGASSGGFAGFPGGVRFEFRGDPEDLAGFSDFFRTFFAGEATAAGPDGSGRGAGRGAGTRTRTRAAGGAGLDLDELLRGMAGTGMDRSGMPGSAAGGGGGGGAGRAVRRRPEAGADVEVSLEEVHGGAERVVQVDERRLEVRIPPGVRDGQRIRLSGRAGSDGDVYLTIRVRPHPVFTRQGDDLSRELPLTLAEMLLGAQVPLGTIGGRTVLLTIPPGTQNGQAIRLAGQGLPRFRAEGRGDLLVRARVVLPTTLDEEGRHLARALADHVRQPDPRGSHRAPPT